MAKIVMVHGAGNSLWGPASIKARWFPALSDGLAWHGVEVDESDVNVAFYGDLFRKDPERGYDPDLDLAGLLSNASGLVSAHDTDVDLDELVKMLADQHLDRLLAQAAAYLETRQIREQARARIEALVGPDTVVVVAHSLGTVVAYETLALHPEWDVAGLVTMGSPLGGPRILDLLEPAPVDGPRPVPGRRRDLGGAFRQLRRPGLPPFDTRRVRRRRHRTPGRQRSPGPRSGALPQQPHHRGRHRGLLAT